MKTPPTIDLNELQHSLEDAYALQVRAMCFVPRGECSWGYRVEAGDGRRYFLKLFRTNSLPAWAAHLVYRLHSEGGIENIVYPLPACSGEVLSHLGGHPAALFDFIEAQSLFQAPSKAETLYRLGELLARLHGCVQLRQDCRRVEQFEIPGRDMYDRIVDLVNRGCVRSGAAGEALRILRPVRKQLEALREEILLFQEKARRAQSPFCICHGDPTPGNILVGASGTPYLIDWDEMLLAPPERDLVYWEKDDVFFDNQPSCPVLDGYRHIAGDLSLDPHIIGFYQRQWTVGEIAVYGQRLLFENHTAQQSEADLDNLKEELNWM